MFTSPSLKFNFNLIRKLVTVLLCCVIWFTIICVLLILISIGPLLLVIQFLKEVNVCTYVRQRACKQARWHNLIMSAMIN